MNNEIDHIVNEGLPAKQELPPERKEAAAIFHEKEYRSVDGPQGEGLRYEAARAALDDSRTITARVVASNESEEVDLILFSPIEYTGDHNVAMLRQKYGDGAIYYFPYVEDVDYSQAVIGRAIEDLPNEAVILFDYQDGQTQARDVLGVLLDDNVTEENFVNSINHQEAAVTHYRGRYEPDNPKEIDSSVASTALIREAFEQGVAEGKYEHLPINGVAVLNSEDLDHLVDGVSLGERMWSIYEAQMVDWLIKDHPSLQAFDKDYFLESIKQENTVTIANFTDGKPVCFLTLNDINDCFWLNQKFYGDGQRTIFCPGIVADKTSGQVGTSISTIKLYAELEKTIGTGVCFATQCTEISREYIPKIIGYATQKADLDFRLDELSTYKYSAFVRSD